MPQFAVHRNPGRNREAAPFVVVVQSARFDHVPRRLVLPLLRPHRAVDRDARECAPVFRVLDLDVVLDPLQIQAVPREMLGPVVASLADDASSDRIIKAIDAVITRAYG